MLLVPNCIPISNQDHLALVFNCFCLFVNIIFYNYNVINEKKINFERGSVYEKNLRIPFKLPSPNFPPLSKKIKKVGLS